jgi:cell division protein FtsW (lipid II flippase)
MGKTLSQICRENKLFFAVVFIVTFFIFSLLYRTFEVELWLLYGFLTSCAAILVLLIGSTYGEKVLAEKE